VAIDVQAFGVNFADVMARVGLYTQAPPPPFIPGFEIAGVVARVGSGVTSMRPGDRVVALCEFGGYASRVVVSELSACPVPQGFSLEKAAGLTVTGVTAHHALMVQGGLQAGESVLIQAAAGGVGLVAIQLARNAGARVIAACGGPKKVAFLHNLGLPEVVDYMNEDLPSRVRNMVGPTGLDVILDSVGGQFVGTGMRLLGPNGRFVAIGAATFAPAGRRNPWQLLREYIKTPRLHPLHLLGQSKSYIGVQMLVIGRHKPAILRRSMEHVLAEAAAGRLDPMIQTVLPAEQIEAAHTLLQGRQTIGKIVMKW